MFLIFTGNTLKNESKDSLEVIQRLLLHGQRKKAVMSALNSEEYALALLIANVCDQSTFQAAAHQYTNNFLQKGTPIHTAATLFMTPIQSSNDSSDFQYTSDFWNGCEKDLDKTWRFHLATIISNKTVGWKTLIVSLGDQLMQLNHVHAAHFCFMVSGCSITSPSEPSSRLVLLGCSHTVPLHRALLTHESLESFKRLEAWEWAKRKSNPRAAISILQPYKLKYAKILADLGFESQAKKYVDTIRKCTGMKTAHKKKKLSLYSKEFIQDLEMFEDRLCVSLGMPNLYADQKHDTSLSNVIPSLLKKIVGNNSKASPTSSIVSNDSDYQVKDQQEVSTGLKKENTPKRNDCVALPIGWVELSDPITLKTYYFNEEENMSSWEKPSTLPISEEKKTITSSLPDGWVELIDPTSKKVYFFNEIEGQSLWDRPGVASFSPAISPQLDTALEATSEQTTNEIVSDESDNITDKITSSEIDDATCGDKQDERDDVLVDGCDESFMSTRTSITVPGSAEIKVRKNKGINPISDDSLTPLSISTPVHSNKRSFSAPPSTEKIVPKSPTSAPISPSTESKENVKSKCRIYV